MFEFLKLKPRVYLDFAAATPMSLEVYKKMKPYFESFYGNPSAIHVEGDRAKQAISKAREKVARAIQVRSDDVFFTTGGTESNNLAIKGYIDALGNDGVNFEDIEIISSKVEHPSVTNTLKVLERQGCKIKWLSVNEGGLVETASVKEALSEKTKLVTLAYANSEIGVVNPISEIGRTIRKFEKEKGQKIIFHTDASQAPMWLSCQAHGLGVNLMTLDSSKFCGPKGGGILIKRGYFKLEPVLKGGSQENGLRPGTENVPIIVGAAEAFKIAQDNFKQLSDDVLKVRDYGITELLKIEGLVLNGDDKKRLPNNINISIPGYDTEYAVVSLDEEGIAAATKSACSGADNSLSKVVYEMTGDEPRALATLRLTFGPEISKRDMDRVVRAIKAYQEKMKKWRKA